MLATGVPTGLSTGDGSETVNVGNAGSVQGILGTLTIRNPEDFTTVNVNDSADTTARTVALSSFASGGRQLGRDHRVGPGGDPLRVRRYQERERHHRPGQRHDQRARHRRQRAPPGLTTSLNSGGGRDTINVGNAGSVQGILGALAIQNTPAPTPSTSMTRPTRRRGP